MNDATIERIAYGLALRRDAAGRRVRALTRRGETALAADIVKRSKEIGDFWGAPLASSNMEAAARKIADGDGGRRRYWQGLRDGGDDYDQATAELVLLRADVIAAQLTSPEHRDVMVVQTGDHFTITVGDEVHEIDAVMGYQCRECETVSTETLGVPVYECGACGEMFAGHEGNRCPECNKFSSKILEDACVDCERGEVEDVAAATCPFCEELIDVAGLMAHVGECAS